MFKKLLLITIVAVFFLIFIGSFVRSTGSGMGCPDWPQCFGEIVPPMDESEIRIDYIEFYKETRIEKNLRLAKVFKLFGLENVLYDRQSNHTTYSEVRYDFNKAWIEYLNRLVGVVVGFLVLGVAAGSIGFWRKDKSIVWLSILSLIILLLEAFLGSIVVSTNLFPELISVHMLLALILICLLMYIYFKAYEINKSFLPNYPKKILFLSFIVVVISLVQLFLGIEVREAVDMLHNEENLFEGVINQIGLSFYIHRSFSIVLLLVNIWLFFLIGRFGLNNRWSRIIVPIICLEIFTGLTLANFDLPKISQPFHLLLASLLIGMQFLNFLYLKFASK